MGILKILSMLLICGAYVGIILELVKRARAIDIDWSVQMGKIIDSSGNQMRKNERKYEEKRMYLSKMGVNYLMKRTVLPEEYFLFRLSLAIITGIIGVLSLNWGIGILIGILGFYIPEVVLKKSNEKNNTKMLKDIKIIYDTIQIKTQGGMFLTDAISECYRNVGNRRLKRALYEMSGKMIMSPDLEAIIDEFNMKFKDRYIDNLCIILKQALDSGKTIEILESVQDQMTDMQDVLALQTKNRVNAKVFWLEVVIFIVGFIGALWMAILSVTNTINL